MTLLCLDGSRRPTAMKKCLIAIGIVALLLVPVAATACGDSGSHGNRVAVMDTSMGTIRFVIYEDKAPMTAVNFITLAEFGFYNGLIFHRVDRDYVIQTGDPTGTGMGGSKASVPLEINEKLKHNDGAVGMARTSDPNSATSQFYICDGAHHNLDGSYAVFGQVIEGMEVVRAIAAVPVDRNDKPLQAVVVIRITIQPPG